MGEDEQELELCGDAACPHCASTMEAFSDQYGVTHWWHGGPPPRRRPSRTVKIPIRTSTADHHKAARR